VSLTERVVVDVKEEVETAIDKKAAFEPTLCPRPQPTGRRASGPSQDPLLLIHPGSLVISPHAPCAETRLSFYDLSKSPIRHLCAASCSGCRSAWHVCCNPRWSRSGVWRSRGLDLSKIFWQSRPDLSSSRVLSLAHHCNASEPPIYIQTELLNASGCATALVSLTTTCASACSEQVLDRLDKVASTSR
jgi:hypothetical protein